MSCIEKILFLLVVGLFYGCTVIRVINGFVLHYEDNKLLTSFFYSQLSRE